MTAAALSLSPETRVLIVEDEYWLAADLRDTIVRAGGTAMGPFAAAADALRAIEESRPTLALVDINLGEGPSFAVAARLAERAIPFAFITGYGRATLPDAFRRVPRLEKPTSTTAVRDMVARLQAGAPLHD